MVNEHKSHSKHPVSPFGYSGDNHRSLPLAPLDRPPPARSHFLGLLEPPSCQAGNPRAAEED